MLHCYLVRIFSLLSEMLVQKHGKLILKKYDASIFQNATGVPYYIICYALIKIKKYRYFWSNRFCSIQFYQFFATLKIWKCAVFAPNPSIDSLSMLVAKRCSRHIFVVSKESNG